MSFKSMTGCGRGSATAGGIRVEVELSSVNRKQFDVHVTIPKALTVLEPRMESLVQKFISRGNVTGMVNVTVSGSAVRRCISVDKNTAMAYVQELRKTARELGLKDDLSARSLVAIPGVIKYESIPEDVEKVWYLLEKSLRKALQALTRMRAQEGLALQKDLLRRFAALRKELDHIKKVAPTITEKYRTSLQQRIEKAGIAGGLSSEQLLREVALFADRSDISEEIVRLESHFSQISGIVKSSEPVGRTMDFLCQEMFREINIGSKANSEEISRRVVGFKAGLESVREQVQNIE